ncbi:Hypothetical predicted protein [Pelobates cultripes]|uniref:Uncharacterized protein n=1 Tax=Pelobates cultripes TaxID=61616 RepID=A0AAD1S5B5_PELCU|nr:Hypothetical predicted protein [Pelobates cultripes]
MDEFLTTPQGLCGTDDAATTTPSSPSSIVAHSSQTSPATSTLAQISADIAKITANMLTRKDKVKMVAELRAVIREEITAVRRDLTALEQCVDDLEVDRLQNAQYRLAAELATGRQGNILLDLRRQVEDLDNRGHRKIAHSHNKCQN